MTRRAGVSIGRGLLGLLLLGTGYGAGGHQPSTAPATLPAAGTASGPTAQKTSAGFILSRQTTFILGPVRPDGTIDYVAALDAHFSRGVTAENNAVIPLLKALGPGMWPVTARAAVYKRLSLQPLPAEGGYFIPLDAYAAAHAPPQTQPSGTARCTPEEGKALAEQVERCINERKPVSEELLARLAALSWQLPEPTAPGVQPKDESWRFRLNGLFARAMVEKPCIDRDDAMKKPWTAKDYPLLAEWLKANEKPLALVVEATKRPRYYVPPVPTPDVPLLWQDPFPPTWVNREVARALAARAMLRFSSGDFQGAREDLLAVHRLARLIAQGPTILDRMVGVAIESLGTSTEAALAAGGHLSAQQARALLADLEALPDLPNLVDVFDLTVRLFVLDAVMVVRAKGIAAFFPEIDIFPGQGLEFPPVLSAVDWAGAGLVDWEDLLSRLGEWLERYDIIAAEVWVRTGAVDWKALLRRGNAWCDRYADAAGRPTARQRLLAMRKVSDDILDYRVQAAIRMCPRALLWRMAKGMVFSRERTDVVGDLLLPRFPAGFSRASEIRDEGIMRLHLARIGLALAAYKAEKGAYPERLPDLSPVYLKTVPQDAFTEAPLRYERTVAGYRLYSLGVNGLDDGGKDRTAGADDLVIRAE